MNETTETKRTFLPPTMALATTQLIEHMKSGKVSDQLTDEELTRCCARDCRPGGNGYGYLQTAIRRCRDDYGVVWYRVTGAGYIECVTPETIRAKSRARRGTMRRACRRTLRELGTVDLAALPDTERSEHLLELAQTGTIARMTEPTTTKKLAARNVQKPIETGKLLEAILASQDDKT